MKMDQTVVDVISARPRVDTWQANPVRVFGGFRIMRTRWYLDKNEDWDVDYEPVVDRQVYRTIHGARAAILTLEDL